MAEVDHSSSTDRSHTTRAQRQSRRRSPCVPQAGHPTPVGGWAAPSSCATLGFVSELEEIRAEVAELRAEVARLRDEAADTRALAAMADRDASGVRTAINGIAKTQMALRETQVEQDGTLRGIAEAVGALVTGQVALTEAVGRHDEVLAQLVAGQADILRRLASEG